MIYAPHTIDESLFEALDDENDKHGLRRNLLMMEWRDLNTAAAKKRDKQMLDRTSAYRVIRSMCAPGLNAILVADEDFRNVRTDDPLALLDVLRKVVTTRCEGNEKAERDMALQDWYTLAMISGETLTTYGRRAVKMLERLTTSGVKEAQCPDPEQQASRFIQGLSNSNRIYYDYRTT